MSNRRQLLVSLFVLAFVLILVVALLSRVGTATALWRAASGGVLFTLFGGVLLWVYEAYSGEL